jgi:hypothetical protein
MPTSPEPRLEHGIQHTSSWSLSGKTQFGRWAVKDFGPRVLRRIRMVFTRRLEGFDWKEVAANLHVSEPTCQDGFWREIRRRALSLEGRVDRQNVIHDLLDQPPVKPASSVLILSSTKTDPAASLSQPTPCVGERSQAPPESLQVDDPASE